MKSVPPLILLIVFVFGLAGCQTSSVSLDTIGSIDNSKWEGKKGYEVLVVGYAYEGANRISFEDQMTRALRRAGVNAEASYISYPAMTSINSNSLNAYLYGADNRAVLFAHALSITRQDHNTHRNHAEESTFGTDHHSWEVQVGAIIEAALYVKEIKAAVWLNRTRFQSESGNASNGMSKYINRLIHEMREADVIQRLK